MPIYEFECRACGKITEVMQKISDAPLEKCPECGGEVAKKMSMTSFSLKGTGWYATDYKKSAAPAAASAPPAESGKAASTEKTETAKPAEKSGGDASASPSAPAKTPASSG